MNPSNMKQEIIEDEIEEIEVEISSSTPPPPTNPNDLGDLIKEEELNQDAKDKNNSKDNGDKDEKLITTKTKPIKTKTTTKTKSDHHQQQNKIKSDNKNQENLEKLNFQLKKTKSVVREIGSQAVWSLSSCKPGFGVEQLRDNCKDTYWQSDGIQPHLVNIQFRKKTTICEIKLFADFKMDESYTPNRISVRAGNHFHDLHEINQIELNEPNGWETITLRDSENQPIRAFLIQIAILSNHQNGRDTHIRQIKINAPVDETYLKVLNLPHEFRTIKFWQHVNLR